MRSLFYMILRALLVVLYLGIDAAYAQGGEAEAILIDRTFCFVVINAGTNDGVERGSKVCRKHQGAGKEEACGSIQSAVSQVSGYYVAPELCSKIKRGDRFDVTKGEQKKPAVAGPAEPPPSKYIYEEDAADDQAVAAAQPQGSAAQSDFFAYGDTDDEGHKGVGTTLFLRPGFSLGWLSTMNTPTSLNHVKYHSPTASGLGTTNQFWDNDGAVHSSKFGLLARYSYPVTLGMWLDGDLFFRQLDDRSDERDYIPGNAKSYVSTAQRVLGFGVSSGIRRNVYVYSGLWINPGIAIDIERTSVNFQAHINGGSQPEDNIATTTSIIYTAALKAKLQLAMRFDALDLFADFCFGVPVKLQQSVSNNAHMDAPAGVTYAAGVTNNIQSALDHHVASSLMEIIIGANYRG